ncbi:hypothetical protein CROQUDRAFT_707517 [Cronartium quercuum f. sp. fusiforme G11]|uniref:DUF155 domain-containing protein n=1 Tax=Cronartium quercuum f. sp. fusiforme G11 TaxID=708437 RepID=A0A9P6NIT7_9BASI|nr:hypothetical protein CROQUDRAFT_707517 [Cronartium quercuum f. sp. fusiforme G11]
MLVTFSRFTITVRKHFPPNSFRSLSTSFDSVKPERVISKFPTVEHKQPKKRPALAHGPPSVLKQALKPTPSSSAREVVGEVVAYSTAEEYDVRVLQRRLADAGYSRPMYNVLGEAIWVPEWSPKSVASESSAQSEQPLAGEVFVFESGSFVSWGLSDAQAAEFLETIIRPTRALPDDPLERNPSREVEREKIESDQIDIGPTDAEPTPSSTRTILTPFPVTPSGPSERLGAPNDGLLLSKLAVSSALARACRLSRYETQLDEFLSKVEHVPMMLKTGHDSPLDKREIMARYGELLELRQGLSLKDENLLDLPEWFWEDTGAEEKHFKKILREFDFERRLRILNDKLSMGIELQERLFEFSNSVRPPMFPFYLKLQELHQMSLV